MRRDYVRQAWKTHSLMGAFTPSSEISCWASANAIPFSKAVPYLWLAAHNLSVASNLSDIHLSLLLCGPCTLIYFLLLQSPMFKRLQANVPTEFSTWLQFILLWPPTEAHTETFQMQFFSLKEWFDFTQVWIRYWSTLFRVVRNTHLVL